MKAFANPLLLVICILLLVFAAAVAAGEPGRLAAESWVMLLCLVAVVVNGTLGLARALTRRPSLMSMGWAVVFLIFACAVWVMASDDASFSVSSQERTLLKQRVKAWKTGAQDPYELDEQGDCVPVLAAGLGQVRLLSLLLEDASAVASHAEVYARAAHRAAEHNREQVLQLLFAAGVPVDARVNGMTPLHAAAMVRARRSVAFLLSQGADIDAGDADGMTPLHHAVLAEDVPMVRLLMQHGADPAQPDAQGRDAASYARVDELLDVLVPSAPESARQEAP